MSEVSLTEKVCIFLPLFLTYCFFVCLFCFWYGYQYKIA